MKNCVRLPCGSFRISSSTAKAFRCELNFISWDSRELVYDIRTWNEAHTEYDKGVTVAAGQMIILKKLLDQIEIF